MKRVFTVQLDVKGQYKQVARVTVHPSGEVETTNPVALNVVEQLLAGTTHGNATTRHASISFKLTNAEFTA